jgi:NAD(P)H-dependent FMN reductase
MTTMIAGIAGSLRRDSVNRQLLHAAARALAPGVQLNTIDLFDHVPPFNEDWEATPAPLAVAELRNLISPADGGSPTPPTLDRRLRAVVYDLLAAVAHRQQAA